MKGKKNKHVDNFEKSKLKEGEATILHLEGWIGEMLGKGDKAQRNGQFFLTGQRVCFYRKGLLGEVFETIPISKITSVETLSRMGYRVLRLHTSHDELTFEDKALFEKAHDELEKLRDKPSATSPQSAVVEDVPSQIKKLSELKDAGILTQDEFDQKKNELLARM